jgi:chemotaxis protein histidine kinase CheA
VPGDTFDEFVEDYFAECDEHLSAIRRLLLSVEGRSPRMFNAAELDDVTRRLETIRALSKIVGLLPAEELAKALDDVLRGTTDAGTAVSKDVLDLLLAGFGLLDRSIQSKRGWHPVPDHRAFIAGTRDFLRRRREVYATAVVQSAPAPTQLADVEIAEDHHRVALVPSPRPRDDRLSGEASVVVDVSRVDDLMRIIAEMVVLRSRLDESLRDTSSAGALDDLRHTNRALERQLRTLREGITRMRRVSIDVLFERIRLITQDMLRGSGRTVRLQFAGTGTSIDAALVDRLLEPLLHVVRIAALHGIEDRAVRLARGKPADGTITLRARTSGDRVVLEAEDDGAGDGIGNGSERLAHGGAINAVRGVISELGGELSVSAAPWRGTKVTIDLPIRDSVTDALLVTVGDQVMAIPLLSLREVLRLEPQTITSLLGAAVIAYRGSALSLLTLHRHFGLSPASEATPHVLVVERGTHRLGLVVDGVLGIREIAVRPVSDARLTAPGIAGATELGDGRLALIIDATVLIRGARGTSFTTNAGDVGAPAVS